MTWSKRWAGIAGGLAIVGLVGWTVGRPVSRFGPLEQEPAWQSALVQAVQAGDRARRAETGDQWRGVATTWRGAIAELDRLQRNDPPIAEKRQHYTKNLVYAEANAANPPHWRNGIYWAGLAGQTQGVPQVQAWQRAIAFLQQVPSGDPHHGQAQDRLPIYQRALRQALATLPVGQGEHPHWQASQTLGMRAAVAAQTAQDRQSWQKVAQTWQEALGHLQQIAPTDRQFRAAQLKIPQYHQHWLYAQSNAQSPPLLYYAAQIARQAQNLRGEARSRQQWQTVQHTWQEAIALLQTMEPNHPDYATAQNRQHQYRVQAIAAETRGKTAPSFLTLKKVITGGLTPKSVVASGSGLFFAQNMMYSHTIRVYDRQFRLRKVIPDRINLAQQGYPQWGKGLFQGAPVEAAFSEGGRFAWVSNYQMYGPGFGRPGFDTCSRSQTYDPSFLYRINTETLAIDRVIRVGAVPKYVATTPDHRYVLVSNWCGGDLSVVDSRTLREIKRIPLGDYPRGIAVHPRKAIAYVAIMGSQDIAQVDLNTWQISWFRGVGAAPRHLVIDPQGRYLYATLNNEGRIAKIDLQKRKVIAKVATGQAPRSMAMDGEGRALYVVNYHSNSMSKVDTATMRLLQSVPSDRDPIGITYDSETRQVWVACYSGSLMVFQD